MGLMIWPGLVTTLGVVSFWKALWVFQVDPIGVWMVLSNCSWWVNGRGSSCTWKGRESDLPCGRLGMQLYTPMAAQQGVWTQGPQVSMMAGDGSFEAKESQCTIYHWESLIYFRGFIIFCLF